MGGDGVVQAFRRGLSGIYDRGGGGSGYISSEKNVFGAIFLQISGIFLQFSVIIFRN